MRAASIKLAIFVVFTTVVTLALASVIGNYRPFTGRYEVVAQFEDATGILKGDIVTLAGVQIGKVKGARVNRGLAEVTLAVDNDVKLPSDSTVVVRYRNLIGQRMVLFKPGAAKTFLNEGSRIPPSRTLGPLDLGMVFNNLQPLLTTVDADDVNTISKALVTSFLEHKSDLDSILRNTATITGDLAKHDEKIASLIANLDVVATELAGQREELRGLLENFADLTTTISARSPSLENAITNLDTATGEYGRLLSNNRSSLDRDIQDLATLLALVVSHQADLDKITSDLDDVLRATARATTYGEWANLYLFSLCNVGGSGAQCTSTTPQLQSSIPVSSGEIRYHAKGSPR